MNISLEDLVNTITSVGYIIDDSYKIGSNLVVDFHHPSVEVKEPIAWFRSSVVVSDRSLKTTVRVYVESFKELFLWYCCENGEFVCRPHVNMDDKILSVEATFTVDPLLKFKELLIELR